jgi:hypothetical protein
MLLAPAAPASNGRLAVNFAYPPYLGSSCTTVDCADPVVEFYVYALLIAGSEPGITGAEYKVQFGPGGAVPGWAIQEEFAPSATVVLGSALDLSGMPSGVNVAWPTCQTGDGTYSVLIETVRAYSLDCQNPQHYQIQVVKHDHPSNQYFQCPLLVLCDAPVYTKVCAGAAVTMCRNPEPPYANNAMCSGWNDPAWINYCPIAVEPVTWSAVKSIYR